MLKDSHKQKGNRQRLVKELREKGIENEVVLKAVENVPRHLFLDSAFERFAYEDRPFSIGAGQTFRNLLRWQLSLNCCR